MTFQYGLFEQEAIKRKQYIEACLEDYLGGEPAQPAIIHQSMYYTVMNGGKRLRPIMVMAAAEIAGGKIEQVIPTACAIEMIHCYSLVHDDLPAMDDDDLRRGQPTCHKVFGEANAILTGDALLTAAFGLIARNADIEGIEMPDVIRVIQEVAQAIGSQGMIGGQVLDLDENKALTAEELTWLHSLKTGQLFKASLRAGAILSKLGEKRLTALTDFAGHFGLAFQISDDILDVRGDPSVLGKPVGSDAKNVRTTYPSLYGIEGARLKAQQSVEACMESLAIFSSEADFLRNLAQFTLFRTY